MPRNSWRNDLYLREFEGRMGCCDLVSFDVFDTLIFRACREPEDVFTHVGMELMRTIPGWLYSPATYRNLRILAWQRAKEKKHGSECAFEEIFREMPFSGEVVREMMRLEIACEKELQYVNGNVYSFLRHAAGLGKKVALVSDMYHSERQILNFLSAAGVDTKLISKCYVSSEYGCRKQSGGLFECLLKDHRGIKADRVLHVGDGAAPDMGGGQAVGMRTLRYPVVPGSFGSLHDFETSVYGVDLGELSSLRKLSASTCDRALDDTEVFFRSFGAEVIAPVYALFADWVAEHAVKIGITRVLPLMREGTLLSELIADAARYRRLKVSCAPVFVSRQPVFIAGIYADNYAERIGQTLLRRGRTVERLFGELGLHDGVFAEYRDKTLCELPEDVCKTLNDYLLSRDDVKAKILTHAARQRGLLLRYMAGMTDGQAAFTVDVGIKGTTERLLHEIWEREGVAPALRHILLMGSRHDNARNILDGVDIVSWLGIAGENAETVYRLKYQMTVIETFISDTCGSVLRYRETPDVKPVLEQETVSENQKRRIAACWAGIHAFQKEWLSLAERKPRLREMLLERKQDFLNLWLRFIECPTAEEATHFGKLFHFDGFNSKGFDPLVADAYKGNADHAAIERYINSEMRRGAYWPQAAVAMTRPEYFQRKLLNNADNPASASMLSVAFEIKKNNYTAGSIFGASEMGMKFREICAAMGLGIRCFIDSDRRLHGKTMDGLRVLPLEEIPCDVEYIVIASYIYAEEMRMMVKRHYGNRRNAPIVYDFGDIPSGE